MNQLEQTLTAVHLASQGRDYRAAHAPRGTPSKRTGRGTSGYNPPLSGYGYHKDRLSHRLGRP